MVQAFINQVKAEPAMFMAVVNAGIALGIGFGLHVTQEQFALIMAFVAALLGFVTRSTVVPHAQLPMDMQEALKAKKDQK